MRRESGAICEEGARRPVLIEHGVTVSPVCGLDERHAVFGGCEMEVFVASYGDDEGRAVGLLDGGLDALGGNGVEAAEARRPRARMAMCLDMSIVDGVIKAV